VIPILAVAIGAILIEVWMLSRRSQLQNLFVFTHLLLFIILFNVLYVITLLTSDVGLRGNAGPNALGSNLLTTLITLGYFAVLANLPFVMGRMCARTDEVRKWAVRVSDRHIVIVFLCWVATKIYLVGKYGVSAFLAYGAIAGDERVIYRDLLDASLANAVETLAVGGIVFFVIRLATIKGYVRRKGVVLPSIAFLILYLGLGEAGIGVRRFLIMLALIGAVSFFQDSSGQFARVLRERWIWMLLATFAVAGFSYYYQVIRTNVDRQEIAEELLSSDPYEVGRGVIHALLPSAEDGQSVEPSDFIRHGPFDLLLTIADSLTEGYRPIGGELTSGSVQMAIPRAILGEQKISINLSQIIAEQFDIVIEPQPLVLDLPMSLLAIFIADYGFPGAFLPPLVILVVIVFYSMVLRRLDETSIVPAMFVVSMLFMTAGSVQTGLTGMLSGTRDLLAFLFVWKLAVLIGGVLKRLALIGPSRRESDRVSTNRI
jgi:hypothetical protein